MYRQWDTSQPCPSISLQNPLRFTIQDYLQYTTIPITQSPSHPTLTIPIPPIPSSSSSPRPQSSHTTSPPPKQPKPPPQHSNTASHSPPPSSSTPPSSYSS